MRLEKEYTPHLVCLNPCATLHPPSTHSTSIHSTPTTTTTSNSPLPSTLLHTLVCCRTLADLPASVITPIGELQPLQPPPPSRPWEDSLPLPRPHKHHHEANLNSPLALIDLTDPGLSVPHPGLHHWSLDTLSTFTSTTAHIENPQTVPHILENWTCDGRTCVTPSPSARHPHTHPTSVRRSAAALQRQ